MDTLVNEQSEHILIKTDLIEIYKLIQTHDPKLHGPLSNKVGMDTISLKTSMVKFYQTSLII